MQAPLNDIVAFHEDGTATITKRSIVTGMTHSRTVVMTKEQYESWTNRGVLVQNAFPELSVDEREFLMTGITPTEWKHTFGS